VAKGGVVKKTFALLLFVSSGAAAAQLPALTPLNLYTISGVANVEGRNGTRFVSDLAVTNPGTEEADVVLSFVPPGTLEDVNLTVQAGRTVVWTNVLQQLWSLAGSAGAILVTSDQRLLSRARTYNTASSGTFGGSLPAVSEDRLLEAGDRGHCLWVSQSGDGTRNFRTNLAVTFPDSGGGSATVTAFDQAGNATGQWEFSASSADFQQVSAGKIAASLPLGRAEIEVTSGRAVAYASVVDNVTGDSSLFPFESLPAGPQDVVVSGVARAVGRNNTFFRTDARIYNPGPSDASLSISFLRSGPENPSPSAATIPIPAGRILDVVDVLATWFSAPAPSTGALRFRSDSPVAVLCRTSNVDPTGTVPGTFGAQQRPRPLLSFLSSADAGALITGIRQSADPNTGYRTNVGFAAGAEGATYQLTLRSAAGSAVSTVTRSLGVFGWEQPAIDRLFTSVPENAQLLVKVTQGSVDVFDSSVDNGSGDSVVTAAPALPVVIPSSATIGPQGGSVRSDDGKLTIRIPAGGLASAANVNVGPGSGSVLNALGSGYALSVDGPGLTKPPIAVYQYGHDELFGSAPEWLGLATTSGADAYALAGASVDTAERTISAPLPLTPPGGLVKSAASRTPLTIFRIELEPFVSLKITPETAAALSGQTVHFRVTGTQSVLGTGKIVRATFNGDFSEWELRSASAEGFAPGSMAGYADNADYTSPATLTCVDKILLVFRYRNPGRSQPYEAKATITLLPRYWDFTAESQVEEDYCALPATNAVRFTLKSDQVSTILTIRDDLTFEPATASHVEFAGRLASSSFCPEKDCTVSWASEPGPGMKFRMSMGGWANGKLYFSYWGFLLNEDGFHEWVLQVSCKGTGTYFIPQLQPNCAGDPVTIPPLRFDGPNPKDSCNARKTFTFKEFRKWGGVPGKFPFDRSTYRLVLTPRQ
jgi:hypothetical protein